MSVIDSLIFDRTNEDLTNDTDKAYISYLDLNRVEECCAYLANILGVTITTKTWEMSDFRTETEMERIRSNVSLLRNVYSSAKAIPQVPDKLEYTTISQANLIEKILYMLNTEYEDSTSGTQRLSFKIGTRQIGNRRQ